MAVITPQTAKEMAARSHEAQRKAKEQRALILAGPPQLTVELVKDCLSQRLERTRKQIELIDDMLDQAGDPDTIDALTRSKERLFRIWAHCAGIPGPGNLKPSSPKQSRAQPVQPMPIPQQVVVEPVQDAPKPANPT